MDRKKLLYDAFQRGNILNLNSPVYRSWIEKFIVDETQGDTGIEGDITTDAVIFQNRKIEAVVETREDGIVAGIEETVFLYKNNNIEVEQHKKDGEKIKKGDILLKLKGTEKDILRIERSALDLLQRMSGIATLTHDLKKKIKERVEIAPTRKTQWRYLDKKAVFVGGGLTHRLALWDAILIKDNHLKALEREGISDPITVSLQRAFKSRKNACFIEIEVTKESEAIKAAELFKELGDNDLPCLIMFDNMPPEKIKSTINKLKRLDLHKEVLFEASGGINPANIESYSITGVDVLSLGYLTHSSHAIDIKQRII